jgi:hypothetical protein
MIKNNFIFKGFMDYLFIQIYVVFVFVVSFVLFPDHWFIACFSFLVFTCVVRVLWAIKKSRKK